MTVFFNDFDGEVLLVGFPRLARREPVQVIPVTGFDPEGEPEIWIMSNGSLSIVFHFMPPSWADADSFDDFDRQIAEATGVAVDWEDDELFRIEKPAPCTIKDLRKFLAAFRREQGPPRVAGLVVRSRRTKGGV